MAKLNHKKEVKNARKELDPIIREIKGLNFMGMSLQNTKTMSDYYYDNLKILGFETCMAFTKAIIVDYGRLWKSTSNKYISSLDKSFFPSNSPVHDELLELRDKLVAHPDKGFETMEIRAGGTTVKNDRYDPNTHQEVFVTLNARAEIIGSMWWIKDSHTMLRIRDHIRSFLDCVFKRLKEIAKLFVSTCQKYAHVIKELNDLFSIREFEDQGNGQRRQPDISEGSLKASEPKPLKIGRTNLVATVSIWESMSHLPKGKVRGPGFTIEISPDGKFNITFPLHSA